MSSRSPSAVIDWSEAARVLVYWRSRAWSSGGTSGVPSSTTTRSSGAAGGGGASAVTSAPPPSVGGEGGGSGQGAGSPAQPATTRRRKRRRAVMSVQTLGVGVDGDRAIAHETGERDPDLAGEIDRERGRRRDRRH